MPCAYPLTAWRGPRLKSGKRSVVFRPGESTPGLVAFPMKLPCGQCFGCRLDYSLDWATRLMHEKQMHEEACFITVTFDDAHYPMGHCHLKGRKECAPGSLCVDTFQRFMKRLRKYFAGGGLKRVAKRYARVRRVRFFHAGEYGERFGRPHYHAILFGVDFADRRFLKSTASGSRIDSSETLSSLWGQGYCSVGDVTFESAAYVARYCLKKVNGKLKEKVNERGLTHYERLDESTGQVFTLRPEYVTMSRNKGIAYEWFKKYKSDIYPHDYSVMRGGVKMPPPRYYDGLYEAENPLDMQRIKLDRVARCTQLEDVWNDTLKKWQKLDANRDERLVVKEEVKMAQMRLLKKKLESGQ